MPAETLGDRGFSEHFLSARDGLKLYFRLYGGGRRVPIPILCLPGLSRNSKDFHDFARHMSGRFDVLCPDYRGVGRSAYAPTWRAYSPQACLDDLRQVLAATNRHRIVTVGTSFGGVLAAALAVALPGAVAGAVLNDIGPGASPGALDHVLAHVGKRRTFASWEAAVGYLKSTFPGMPAGSEERWRRIAANTFREEDGCLTTDWDPAIAKPLPRLLRDSGDLWPLFRSLKKKRVLALRGAHSEVLGPATFDRMANELPRLEPITVPGVGHAPDMAEPPLLDLIERFLDGI